MAKQKVLVVEDEELMRNILRTLLEDEGYEVPNTRESVLYWRSREEAAERLADGAWQRRY